MCYICARFGQGKYTFGVAANLTPCCCVVCLLRCKCSACSTIRDHGDPQQILDITEGIQFETDRIVDASGMKPHVAAKVPPFVAPLTVDHTSYHIMWKFGKAGKQFECCKAGYASIFNRKSRFLDVVIRSVKTGEVNPKRKSGPRGAISDVDKKNEKHVSECSANR